ncbi:unnamed protein product [Lupinus luteus]|uniref:Rapid ALkalinization Factor n=1 Tax=Lupinus luteus TaxID=3873 RepID=A0AAV1WP38_LUPLU
MATISFLLTLYLFFIVVSIYPPTVIIFGNHRVRWVPTTTTTTCQGSIEECIANGDDSKSHRRILEKSEYISYNALQPNTVPCSQRGSSYYNCKPEASVNPYTRGCNTITHCRHTYR